MLDGGFVVWRTPLLPLDILQHWNHRPPATDSAALDRERTRLRNRLRSIVAEPDVRDALWFSSASLFEAVEAYTRANGSRRAEAAERTLSRYLARLASRPTPFGLSAGHSVGSEGNETDVVLVPARSYRRCVRLHGDVVDTLIRALGRQPESRGVLRYRVNSSLYRLGSTFRYYVRGPREERQLTTTPWTSHLDAIVKIASEARTIEQLAASLLDSDPDLPRQEVADFLDALIDAEVLVDDLSPPVTGPEPSRYLLESVTGRLRACGDRLQLNGVQQTLEKLNGELSSAGNIIADHREVASDLKSAVPELEATRVFQVHLVKPAERATLGTKVIDELQRGIAVLHRIALPDTSLDRFKTAFHERFEDREVSLAVALDEESGITFPWREDGSEPGSSPLIAQIRFADEPTVGAASGKRERHLRRRIASRDQEILLTQDDLDSLQTDMAMRPLPDAFSAWASIAAASVEDLRDGRFQVLLKGSSGPAGMQHLGRFCHGDPELTRMVREHVRREEALRADAVHAEVVYRPGHFVDAVHRPSLRQFEIPYLGRSGAPASQQLPIGDLSVCIERDRLVLRSKRLQREVIPRLTSAVHAADETPAIYRFLVALQDQGLAAPLHWSWGALADEPFLPRVRAGRTVLARATWNLADAELHRLRQLRGNDAFVEVQRLREVLRLPRWVYLADGDRELLVDLDNVLCVDSFAHLLRQRAHARLIEMFPGPDELFVRGPEGRFVHELIVPFLSAEPSGDTAKATRQRRGTDARAYPPGSEWLSASIGMGNATLDHFLCRHLSPFIDTVMTAGDVDRFFFLRHAPPWHLRLRLHGQPTALHGPVLEQLKRVVEPLLASGEATDFDLKTYRPEQRRYGGSHKSLDIAEQVFQADSLAAIELVPLFLNTGEPDERWLIALLGCHTLLCDLGLDLETRMRLAQRCCRSASQPTTKSTTGQVGTRFRAHRAMLETLVEPEFAPRDEPFATAKVILARRSVALEPLLGQLRELDIAGELNTSVQDLAAHFVHMHLNRILRAGHGPQEILIWEFLRRTYRSRIVRGMPC